MIWRCKICRFLSNTKGNLVRHYRLQHATIGHQPCLHDSCPCTFKTYSALHTHLSRYHRGKQSQSGITIKCAVCNAYCSTEKDYFQHLGNHLKIHETVCCVYEGCNFRTNIYNTFVAHKSRKHKCCSLSDFRKDLYADQHRPTVDPVDLPEASGVEDISLNFDQKCTSDLVVQRIGFLLLKLETIYNVSVKCVDALVEDLQFISSSACVDVVKNIIDSTFKSNQCAVDQSIISDLAVELCNLHPLSTALSERGPLGSAFKRRRYFKNYFQCVNSVEYTLDAHKHRTFQYVPILETLQELLKNECNIKEILSRNGNNSQYIKSIFDGKFYKQNGFYTGDEPRLSIILYVDDFELCNPLGTSKKKHKVTAVYWLLGNLSSKFQSSLTSIHLALLCKADDVKQFHYKTVLEPLLKDLATLEEKGIFISSLGKSIRGTVHCVVADNLGAHSLSGLVESFTGPYICRFCLGHSSEFQTHEVQTGVFPPRTKEDHSLHVLTVKNSPNLLHCFGVKHLCPLTEKLNHFHFVTGYPPDVLHDLFEGIIPRELALCFQTFTKKRYFSLSEFNDLLGHFPFKGSDKANCPQAISRNYIQRRSTGGNAHENWALIRFLPLIVGSRVPEGESAWQVLLNLKDIVELVVAPAHTVETLAYLSFKIAEHREQFLAAFPEESLIPKHHFLEHYPALIESFGPLVAVWTMRFEAKHSFFKQVVRHTKNFKNVLLTLATRHQLMMAYQSHTDVEKAPLCVTKVTDVSVGVLHSDIQKALKETWPLISTVQLANTVTYYGTRYTVGMILANGSTGGLPDFVEIVQIAILNNSLHFFVKLLAAWYEEHLRSFQLEDTGKLCVVEQQNLSDTYPLEAYSVGGKRWVTLKRHICF